MDNSVPIHKQPYLYFTVVDHTVDVPSVKIIKINSNSVYISYIANIIPGEQDNPIKQTQFRWSNIQDLPNYVGLAHYIETCFPDNASIVIRSNMLCNKIPYSMATLRVYMDMLFSVHSIR